MAFWIPDKSADPSTNRVMFGFESVLLRPAESAPLSFSMPADAADLATVTEDGHREMRPGNYTVRFTRGHDEDPLALPNVLQEEIKPAVYDCGNGAQPQPPPA